MNEERKIKKIPQVNEEGQAVLTADVLSEPQGVYAVGALVAHELLNHGVATVIVTPNGHVVAVHPNSILIDHSKMFGPLEDNDRIQLMMDFGYDDETIAKVISENKG